MDEFEMQYQQIRQYPGGVIAYLSNALVKDNTKSPISGKYMLESFGQYNVGILLVRFIQLYTLKKRDPVKYNNINFRVSGEWGETDDNLDKKDYSIGIFLSGQNYHHDLIDLPYLLQFQTLNKAIVLNWHQGHREDNLLELILNEDSCVISARFGSDDWITTKSSDGTEEYYLLSPHRPRTRQLYNRPLLIRHRPQEEGPAIITTEGDSEYWELGVHIRSERRGHYIKRARR